MNHLYGQGGKKSCQCRHTYNPPTLFFLFGIEGLAAGAMLTMIAETMLPEAYVQGGAVVGMSTLFGFLACLFVKSLE